MSDDALTLLSTNDVAQHLKIGSDRVRELARQNRISHRRIGRKFWFTAADIRAYIDSFTTKGNQR